jgi:type II secretory pathway pseudopilin PulG
MRGEIMTNEIAFTIMAFIAVLAVLYMVWWTNKQEREEERKQESR